MVRPSALLLILVTMPLLAGCSTLLGQRYTNFTAYYNTFYNAQRAFEREERTILRADPPVERERFLPLFPRPAQAARGQGLETAIRKAADVLRDHPSSKWVDDALLLIGKAYFYQGNYDAAAQKFRELLALEGNRLADEAHLWLGRSLLEAEDFAGAAGALRDGLERPGVRERSAGAMRLVLGEVDVRRGDYAAAVQALRAGFETTPDRELAARAAFLLGQTHDALGDPQAAADAYALALARRPSPELLYAAEIQRALALSRSERADRALTQLTRLSRDDKYVQQRAEVELVRARVLAASGRADEARSLLHRLLYDRESGLRIDRVRGPIHYRLGELYRDRFGDYARAAAHFDTAAVALRQATPVRDPRLTPEAITDADRASEAFGAFARARERVADLDSLLHLGTLDDEAFAEAIAAIGEQRRAEAAARQRELRRIEERQGFAAAAQQGGAGLAQGTASAAGAEGAGAAGFLAYQDPVRVAEGRVAFQTRWGDRPYVPNWRRAAAVSAAVSVRGDLDDDRAETSSAAGLDQTRDVFVDVSAIPRTPEAQLALRRDRALARYELGNVLFLSLQEPETAIEWYLQVIEEDGEFPVAVRAYYALAEAHTALGQEAQAEELYRAIAARFPDDPIARTAHERLGLPTDALPADSLRLAEDAYALAFSAWQRNAHADALRQMLDVGDRYARSEVAARARLAAALIYTEWAAGDTLTLLAPHPDPLLKAVDPLGVAPVPADTLATVPTGGEGPPAALDLPLPELPPLPEGLAALPPPPAEEPWVETLYASIEADFPGTRYAERARALRQAVEEHRLAYLASRPAAEPAPAEPGAPEPSVGEGPPVEVLPEAPPPSGEAGSFDPSHLRGDEPLDADAGGYTWVVLRTPRPLEAQNRIVAFHNRGFRTALLVRQGEAEEESLILIGQFPTEAEALAAREALPLGSDPAAITLLALDGVGPLVSVADLLGQ
jgi:cellulose synthase operon protein C